MPCMGLLLFVFRFFEESEYEVLHFLADISHALFLFLFLLFLESFFFYACSLFCLLTSLLLPPPFLPQ